MSAAQPAWPRRLAGAGPGLRWLVLVVAVAGSALLLALVARHARALASADCPVVPDAVALSASSLELAGGAARALDLLRPRAPEQTPGQRGAPDAAERVCLEARAQVLQAEIRALDAGVFMPMYALLTLGLVACAQAGPGGTRLRVWVAVLPSLALLLALDATENHRTLALLAQLWPAALQPDPPTLTPAMQAAAEGARAASLGKWAAAAPWCLALAWAIARGWPWVAQPGWGRSWQWGSAAALGLAALVLGGTAAWGWAQPQALAGLLRAIDVGMGAAVLGLVLGVLRVAWARPAAGTPPPPPPGTGADGPGGTGGPDGAPDTPDLGQSPAREFHLEEYRQIRAEVVGQLARIEGLMRGSVVACALAFSWLVSQSLGVTGSPPTDCLRLPQAMLLFAWWLPPALVLMAGLMAAVLARRVGSTGHYLHRLERALGQPPLGWEAHLQPQQATVTATSAAIWVLLLVLSLGATAVGHGRVSQATHACEAGKTAAA